ncbi:hypothetical protein [Actinomadura gamaensis]|uniref:EamA domain-containing protein n=1 Tax=Actinomadura gamaensis TaxID=1763541 RepID=A0ABV9TXE5_9ACTN
MTTALAVIFAGVLHATWNAIAKGTSDRWASFALIGTGQAVLAVPVLMFVSVPAAASWPWLFGSVVLHLVYMGLLLTSYQLGDFSQVYPLARGSAPLIVALVAATALGEHLSLLQLGGVAAICGGLTVLAFATPEKRPPARSRGGRLLPENAQPVFEAVRDEQHARSGAGSGQRMSEEVRGEQQSLERSDGARRHTREEAENAYEPAEAASVEQHEPQVIGNVQPAAANVQEAQQTFRTASDVAGGPEGVPEVQRTAAMAGNVRGASDEGSNVRRTHEAVRDAVRDARAEPGEVRDGEAAAGEGVGRRRTRSTRAVMAALATGVAIASYTVLDGIGVRAAHGAIGYSAWLFALEAPLTVLIVLALRGRRALSGLAVRTWMMGLAGGVLAMAGYGIVLWAQTRGALAAVAALRETGVIAGAVIGAVFFAERMGARRIAAACVVAAGVVLITGT